MLLEIVATCVLLAWPDATFVDAGKDVTGIRWTAVVRSFSRGLEPQWKLVVRRESLERVSARLWLIAVSQEPEEAGERQRDPGWVGAKTANLTSDSCPVLVQVAGEFERLAPLVASSETPTTSPAQTLFELESPEIGRVDLRQLPEGHPLVQWSTWARQEVAICAGMS